MGKISSQLDTYTYNAILQYHRDTRHDSPALHCEYIHISNITLHTILELARQASWVLHPRGATLHWCKGIPGMRPY